MKTKRILLPLGGNQELANKFGVNDVMVSRALGFQRNSPMCIAIRKAALEMGGRLYDGTRSEEDAGKIVVLRQGETMEQYKARTGKTEA